MVLWPNGTTQKPRVTSRYGPRASFTTPGGSTSNFHAGTDMVGFEMIKAPVDGVIELARYNGGYGNYVRVRRTDGYGYGHAHIAPGGFRVREGQTVKAGQDVGVMGTTGLSTGVHLHWEVYPPAGGTVNPETHMATGSVAGSTEEDVMNAEQEAKLDWIMKQIGGSNDRATSLRQDVDKLTVQVGGSDSRSSSLRQDVDGIVNALTTLAASVEWGNKQLGGSNDRTTSLRQDVDAIGKLLESVGSLGGSAGLTEAQIVAAVRAGITGSTITAA